MCFMVVVADNAKRIMCSCIADSPSAQSDGWHNGPRLFRRAYTLDTLVAHCVVIIIKTTRDVFHI